MKPTPLGKKMRDRVTGFTGIVTGRAEYLGDSPSLRITSETGQEDERERWVPEKRCDPAVDVEPTGFGA